jgi:hypothetical protein
MTIGHCTVTNPVPLGRSCGGPRDDIGPNGEGREHRWLGRRAGHPVSSSSRSRVVPAGLLDGDVPFASCVISPGVGEDSEPVAQGAPTFAYLRDPSVRDPGADGSEHGLANFTVGTGSGIDHPRTVHTVRKGSRMEIDKSQIIELLKSRGEDAKAAQAEADLPDKVDPQVHASVLAEVGIDPQDLLGDLPGGLV